MIDLFSLSRDLSDPSAETAEKMENIIKRIYKICCSSERGMAAAIEKWEESFESIYGNENRDCMIFARQTFYSILIKMIVDDIFSGSGASDFEDVIYGKAAECAGIVNYCDDDIFCWPVKSAEAAELFGEMKSLVEGYRMEMEIAEFVKRTNCDYIKQIYEAVIPKKLRHSTGEYYTPDWMADIMLDRIEEIGGAAPGSCNIGGAAPESCGGGSCLKDADIIDPACGSGTFLFRVIGRKRRMGCSLEEILRSVHGMDINPLAVLTAKTNYIISVADMICDEKICGKMTCGEMISDEMNQGKMKIAIPVVCGDVLECQAAAKGRSGSSGKAPDAERYDIVIGNPPWVNREYMPRAYREKTEHLWRYYNLISAAGRHLSFSKGDLSELITYAAADRLLDAGGILAFVIRHEIFKSAKNGAGFRRFTLKGCGDYEECGEDLGVELVEDMVAIRPFDNAVNSTAILYLRKGRKTAYPVRYIMWKKAPGAGKFRFDSYSGLSRVMEQVAAEEQLAEPADGEDITSQWLAAPGERLESIRRCLGSNGYRARTGVFTGGANAVYHLEARRRSGDAIEISNITRRAKRKVADVTAVIEPDFVYPMLKGMGIRRWGTSYDSYILCPHTDETKIRPVPEAELRRGWPLTYGYLDGFRQFLNERKGFAGWEKAIQKENFHSVLRVGEYTFAPYKVVWRYIARDFISAVISEVEDTVLGRKLLIPNEKVMFVATGSRDEAYYLCGVLSSRDVAECVRSYMNPTSISAHVLEKLEIPKFDPDSSIHMAISESCRLGHVAVRENRNLSGYMDEIERLMKLLRKQ